MEMLSMFAAIGLMFNNLVALASAFGSAVMLLRAFVPARKFGEIADWSLAGLVFGGFFQLCILFTGLEAERIGILLPLPINVVNALFVTSLFLVLLRWNIRRQRQNFR